MAAPETLIDGVPDLSAETCSHPRVQTALLERLKAEAFAKWPDFVDSWTDSDDRVTPGIQLEYTDDGGSRLPMSAMESARLNNSASLGIRVGQHRTLRYYYSGDHLDSKGMRVTDERNGVRGRYRIDGDTAAGTLNRLKNARLRTVSFGEMEDALWKKSPEGEADDVLVAAGGEFQNVVGNLLRREATGEKAAADALSTTIVDPEGYQMQVKIGERTNAQNERSPFVTVSVTGEISSSYRQEHFPDIDDAIPVKRTTTYEFSLESGRVDIRCSGSDEVGDESQSLPTASGKANVDQVRLLRNFLARPLIRHERRIAAA
jgi:hypothetical protein